MIVQTKRTKHKHERIEGTGIIHRLLVSGRWAPHSVSSVVVGPIVLSGY